MWMSLYLSSCCKCNSPFLYIVPIGASQWRIGPATFECKVLVQVATVHLLLHGWFEFAEFATKCLMYFLFICQTLNAASFDTLIWTFSHSKASGIPNKYGLGPWNMIKTLCSVEIKGNPSFTFSNSAPYSCQLPCIPPTAPGTQTYYHLLLPFGEFLIIYGDLKTSRIKAIL